MRSLRQIQAMPSAHRDPICVPRPTITAGSPAAPIGGYVRAFTMDSNHTK
jgi:hypothetical protein